MTTFDRPKIVARISSRLLQQSFPRLQMTLIVLVTGLVGFLASFSLLHLGVTRMWIRYPLAVAFSYGGFFLLLRIWIQYQKEHRAFSGDGLDLFDLDPGIGPSFRTTSASHSGRLDWFPDSFPDLDGDEWLIVILLLAALVIGICACFFIVLSAPTLLAEIFLDAVLIASLRRKMVRVAEQHWTKCVLRKTVLPFLILALILSLTGGVAQNLQPEAQSIGQVFHAENPNQ